MDTESWQETTGGRRRLRLLVRLIQISLIVARHVSGSVGERLRGWAASVRGGDRIPAAAIGPRRVRRMIEDLGVGFIKVGQLLAARADLLPERYHTELVHLRDNCRPVAVGALIEVLEAAWGQPLASVLATFSEEPVAAASVSQVHRGVLPDGRVVAVKVRRPGIVAIAQADLALLALAAGVAQRLSRRARMLDPGGIAAEVATMLRQELDFVAEAANALAIREVFAEDPTVVVPAVIAELSGPLVVVMEFLEGIPLADVAALEAAGCSPRHYAASVIRANVAMILGPSRFHADLHPGNLLALGPPYQGRLGMVDFGAAGSATDQRMSEAVGAVMDAMTSGDADGLAGGVLLMTESSEHVDRNQLAKELDQAVLRPLGNELGAVPMGQLLRDLIGVLHRHALRVRPEVTALLRAVMTCESTARELDPGISFRKVVVPFLVTRAFGWEAHAAALPEAAGLE